ncbi:MAG: UDP-N-acetylmuramate dehydrogenase [Deltaproteobacteria bacterium]|nr:UDP-N-acetylmuramate dehydrogenase [Deltaproteobacteria bacterium]TLN02671.1 MAG: UDP-N-acetylmuramate dehydrogenase [bacterium]
MARHTSLRVGGPADWFVVPTDTDDLQSLLTLLGEYEIPFLVVGGGYNLLVRDGGIRGCVISLERLNLLEREGDCMVQAGAGVENGALVRFCRKEGLSGLEFLVGIPGRLGGALAMNAGAGGGEITDSLETLVTLKDRTLTKREKSQLVFGYRFLILEQGEIVIKAAFRLTKADPSVIGGRIAGFLEKRRITQQVGYPNAGSFFKNPAEGPAWHFIDGAGLRGLRIGGAEVSTIHANFLVNRGEASAADFLALAARVKETVREHYGVELQEEVIIVGEDRKR